MFFYHSPLLFPKIICYFNTALFATTFIFRSNTELHFMTALLYFVAYIYSIFNKSGPHYQNNLSSSFFFVFFLLKGLLFFWEQYEGQESRMYYAHRSMLGVGLIILRILLAALLAWNLYTTIRAERSALKREFYASFTKVIKPL